MSSAARRFARTLAILTLGFEKPDQVGFRDLIDAAFSEFGRDVTIVDGELVLDGSPLWVRLAREGLPSLTATMYRKCARETVIDARAFSSRSASRGSKPASTFSFNRRAHSRAPAMVCAGNVGPKSVTMTVVPATWRR